MTECSGPRLEIHRLGKRAALARFDGGYISSDGGALLWREVETRTGVVG